MTGRSGPALPMQVAQPWQAADVRGYGFGFSGLCGGWVGFGGRMRWVSGGDLPERGRAWVEFGSDQAGAASSFGLRIKV
jgi:hypothetical protein